MKRLCAAMLLAIVLFAGGTWSAPSIDSISPATGNSGTTVRIHGTGFLDDQGAGSAAIGAVAITNYLTWSDTLIVGLVGFHALGTADLVVTDSTSSADTLAGAFTYTAPLLQRNRLGYGFGY